MSPASDDLLATQRAYYAARAPSYERGLYDWPGVEDVLDEVMRRVPIGGSVLEFACGTGVWTQRLLGRTSDLTAVDAAAEMIAIAKGRAPGAHYVVADIFGWSPPRRYETVFFSAWLSHVPVDRFAEFWTTVRSALAPGGRVIFVDEHVSVQDKESWVAPGVVERVLPDGSTHRIVKHYVDPKPMQRRLADLGWRATIEPIADGMWVVGTAAPGEV